MLITWLMPQWIANSLALVEVILTTWWIILMISLLYKWICDIDIATWFLILVSEMTIEEAKLDDALRVILLSALI